MNKDTFYETVITIKTKDSGYSFQSCVRLYRPVNPFTLEVQKVVLLDLGRPEWEYYFDEKFLEPYTNGPINLLLDTEEGYFVEGEEMLKLINTCKRILNSKGIKIPKSYTSDVDKFIDCLQREKPKLFEMVVGIK